MKRVLSILMISLIIGLCSVTADSSFYHGDTKNIEKHGGAKSTSNSVEILKQVQNDDLAVQNDGAKQAVMDSIVNAEVKKRMADDENTSGWGWVWKLVMSIATYIVYTLFVRKVPTAKNLDIGHIISMIWDAIADNKKKGGGKWKVEKVDYDEEDMPGYR